MWTALLTGGGTTHPLQLGRLLASCQVGAKDKCCLHLAVPPAAVHLNTTAIPQLTARVFMCR
jgi:hypothetical protein